MPAETLPGRLLLKPRALGVLLAALAFQQSTMPTLMAREWYLQGVVSGLAVGLSYGAGSLLMRLVWALNRVLDVHPRRLTATELLWVRGVFAGVLVVLVTLTTRQAVRQHRWTAERLGVEPSSPWWTALGIALVTVVVAALVVLLARGLSWLRHSVTWLGSRVMPRWASATLATVLVLWVVAYAAQTWVYAGTLRALNEAFTLADTQLAPEHPRPESERRSGGPASAVAWEELGVEGRRFVAEGPSVPDIVRLGRPGARVVEPVRAFVGRRSEADVRLRARLAVEELERLGGLERGTLLVAVPTGKGWVNEQMVQPLEHLLHGDVATVSMQYSHLPSPLAFLAETEAALDAGQALVSAVEERIETLPEEDRPRLLVAGESLGAYGASAAFVDFDDLLARTDGSLWVGSPSMTRLRQVAEEQRRPGSLQIRPVLDDHPEVLFANRPDDLTGRPRAVFLQQADDAIVWWDWSVLWRRPDWLAEPLDPSVNPAMEWYPMTTFLNLAIDMAVSTAFAEGQGHMYGTQPTRAWWAMLRPEGWDERALAALLEEMAEIERPR
ncbi:alpha/beta-hydrolase family protein [Nocardioides sp. Y6]|uniref:Alpha/beta-hydrolase family protein n=1 Tax=Nocardioides malaquae TaxID=2773426 RepID=A0ABR9RRD2_9ACTN|nr:alpha/beta-hydrolase family protein [Nocardioides malaquae]MBE7324142.1 alpha/beta-hydrolase family protein [Nocardioides malaquae]